MDAARSTIQLIQITRPYTHLHTRSTLLPQLFVGPPEKNPYTGKAFRPSVDYLFQEGVGAFSGGLYLFFGDYFWCGLWRERFVS